MNEFKKNLRKRFILSSAIVIFDLLLSIYHTRIPTITTSTGNQFADGMVESLIFGIIFTIGFLALSRAIRINIIFKDKNQLQMEYEKEQNQQRIIIQNKSGMPLILITSTLFFIGSIIGSHFHVLIFYTLSGAALFQLTIASILKIYYFFTLK